MIFPHTVSENAFLRVTRTHDLDQVHELLVQTGVPHVPPVAALREILPRHPDGYEAQFLVESREEKVIGFSALHGLKANNQHIHANLFTSFDHGDAMVEAGALTINYAFSMWNLRKVYFWTFEESVRALEGGPVEPRHEGTLKEYVFDGEALRDVHILAVYRDDWITEGLGFVSSVAPNGGP